ncbi:hypothetical protein V8F20_001195 [Naviculisporaceae sp. PSN 640]
MVALMPGAIHQDALTCQKKCYYGGGPISSVRGSRSCCRSDGPVMVKRKELYVACGCGCSCLNSAKNEVAGLYKCAPMSGHSGCGSLELWLLGWTGHECISTETIHRQIPIQCIHPSFWSTEFFVLFRRGVVVRKRLREYGGRGAAKLGAITPDAWEDSALKKAAQSLPSMVPATRTQMSIHTSISFWHISRRERYRGRERE